MPEAPQWRQTSDNWMYRSEHIAKEHWLTCWRRPDGYTTKEDATGRMMPYGWVRVYEYNDLTPAIEDHRVEDGPLELECIAYEMRKKYGSSIT